MQDGDFVVVIFPCIGELKKLSECQKAIRELVASISCELDALGAALRASFAPAGDLAREILDLVTQYVDGEYEKDLENKSFPEIMNCYIPESGCLVHQRRIPWHTSGFQ